jgi:hypothetical protein
VLRPVAVAAPTPERSAVARPVDVTPHGVRVEGLDRAGLIVVLRALG